MLLQEMIMEEMPAAAMVPPALEAAGTVVSLVVMVLAGSWVLRQFSPWLQVPADRDRYVRWLAVFAVAVGSAMLVRMLLLLVVKSLAEPSIGLALVPTLAAPMVFVVFGALAASLMQDARFMRSLAASAVAGIVSVLGPVILVLVFMLAVRRA